MNASGIHAHDRTTCVILGTSEQANLKVLKAALRMPPRRLVIGTPTPSIASFMTAAGAGLFECQPAGSHPPDGLDVVVLDARRMP